MNAILTALVSEKVLEALEAGRKILILGGRTTNFPAHLREDTRLVFWDSTDPDTRRPKPVPEHVGLALMTRFNHHTLTERVRMNCDKLGIALLGPLSTGQITGILKEAITELEEEKAEEASPTGNETVRPDYSGLSDFLISEVPSAELTPELLESTEKLAHLEKLAKNKWPRVSLRRVKRALRQGMHLLGMLTPDAFEPDTFEEEEEELDEAVEPEEEVRELKSELAKVQSDLLIARAETRGLHRRIRNFERRLATKEAKLAQKHEDLKFVSEIVVEAIRILAHSGTEPSMREEDEERFLRILNEIKA